MEVERRHALSTIERRITALIKKVRALFRVREAEMLHSLSSINRTASITSAQAYGRCGIPDVLTRSAAAYVS
jgi:hypothetical protein